MAPDTDAKPVDREKSSSTIDRDAYDSTDPYCIHHSDHPGIVLASIPLTGDNYSTWSRKVRISLSLKNKTGFIEGPFYWDELGSYNDTEVCSCGAKKSLAEREEQQRLMQFLMGLNESYAAIRGQILLMEPLPSVRMAYSLLS
ncbi:hypothetical protein PRUPE_2G169400 [Prunus persica]|uniref:Retrotransposon Copia-like N-terminal domain-containing protein n=1 Tax=Prunus persica TaxID=3760 RepID=A0A251QH74_PRUPE|nr:hypothetical protein PRUPE_2G169400 [Prunus persica]